MCSSSLLFVFASRVLPVRSKVSPHHPSHPFNASGGGGGRRGGRGGGRGGRGAKKMRPQSDGKSHLGTTLTYTEGKPFPDFVENATAPIRADRSAPGAANGGFNNIVEGITPLDLPTGGLVDDAPIKFLPLGGLGEIGMNCALVGTENRYVLLDAGLMFPDHEELGIQKVLPDVSFLSRWRDKIEAVLITHGHEDHIGALPWVIPALDPCTPVYGGMFTMQLIERKMKEFNLWGDGSRFHVIDMGERFNAGPFAMEAVRVTHSIPDCCGFIFRCAAGTIVHTGDWKIDENPVDGRIFDREQFERVGKEGVTLMMSDSTNVLSPGRTISESVIRESMMQKVLGHKGRIITTQFASNIHRLYGVKAAADASGRKIAFVGMSLNTYLEAAAKSGIAPIDPNTLVPAEDIDQMNPSELIIVTTGSQAEPRAQLAQAAFGSSRFITLHPDDLLLYSAKMIPGNEKRVMRMMNAIAVRGPEIAMRKEDGLHSSGHAYREELEEILKMLHPEHFLPVHGEYAFLKEHEALARSVGVRHSTVIGNGQMLGVTPLRNSQSHGLLGNMHLLGEARLQTMFNDGGKGSGTSEDLAIEERMRIATEGIVVVDLEVFDQLLQPAVADDGEKEDTEGAEDADASKPGGRSNVVTAASGFMTARARVTSRSMWTDEGRLLANLRDAAERSVEGLETGARLSAVERTAASAVRFACRNYCNKRPDIIVVAHRGVADAEHTAKRLAAAADRGAPRGKVGSLSEDTMVGASGTRYRPRARSRQSAPTGVRPLRRSDGGGDGGGGPGGGGNRHMRSDPSYQ